MTIKSVLASMAISIVLAGSANAQTMNWKYIPAAATNIFSANSNYDLIFCTIDGGPVTLQPTTIQPAGESGEPGLTSVIVQQGGCLFVVANNLMVQGANEGSGTLEIIACERCRPR